MDIVLDSNIFRGDLLLRSKDVEVLLDYLKKSSSSIIMPQIILDEISGLYTKALTERIIDYNKSLNNISLTLTESSPHLRALELDKDTCLADYLKHIKQRLNIREVNILPYKNEFLPVISKRAINRQKPAGDDGQGFRDTLIWLTILEYANKSHEKQIIFISNNHNDFGYKDKTGLYETLTIECESSGVNINYFRDLKEFIVNHSTKIAFITSDWISENFDYESFSIWLCEIVNTKGSSRITSSFQGSTGNEVIGQLIAKKASPYNNGDLFIYEMLDNKLIVNTVINCEVLVEFDYYQRNYGHSYEDYFYQQHSTESKWLDVEAYVSITIIDKQIEDFEIDEWDFYEHW